MDTVSLTVFLLKVTGVSGFEMELLSPKASEQLGLATGLDGVFLPLPMPARSPGWVTSVQQLLQTPSSLSLTSQSPEGLLVIRRQQRSFVITFGRAWMRLKDEWLEPDFGRRVALNTIGKDQLIAIRTEQVFAKWHLSNERAPRAASVDEFGVEFDRDLVAVIEGQCSDSVLGKTVRGGTSLRITVDIATLGTVLDKVTSLFCSSEYRKYWPEIDNLRIVTDQGVAASLEAQLDADLLSGSGPTKIILFTPYQRQGDPVIVDSYVVGRLTKSPAKSPYLTYGAWDVHLKRLQRPPSVVEAKSTPIHLLDEDDQELSNRRIFDCFGYETALNGQQYVLSSGIWYEVDVDFQKRIERIVRRIPASKITLPPWNQIDTETVYNSACVMPGSMLLHFDAKNLLFGGGQSKFEFCDLMHPGEQVLLFAKIASKASGMSHLLEQVRRTSELLFSVDPGYRKRLTKIFGKFHPNADASWLKNRPRPGDWNLCFVSLGRKKEQLPFFAKCGLARAYGQLRERGHEVSFMSV